MASVDSTGTLPRPDHPVSRPTAPLPAPAVEALARLELAFAPLSVVRAVARYEDAVAARDELTAIPAAQWSPAEFDSFTATHDALVESVLTLGEAGRLDLIEVTR